MKTFLWLLTLAFAVVCLGCWAMSDLALRSLDTDRPLPAITNLVIRPNGWILICPIPWLAYALFLTTRQSVTIDTILIFSGTLVLATAILICAVVIASVIPFMTFKELL